MQKTFIATLVLALIVVSSPVLACGKKEVEPTHETIIAAATYCKEMARVSADKKDYDAVATWIGRMHQILDRRIAYGKIDSGIWFQTVYAYAEKCSKSGKAHAKRVASRLR
jgi:hypothetical protein